jgi:hypothetical protein
MNKELKADLLKRIKMIWVKKQRVPHREFVRSLSNATLSGGSANIPKQTFSRILHEFLQEYGITKYRTSELQTILDGTIREAINKGLHGHDELRSYVTNF